MAKTYHYRITVEGRGAFPYDMLRYDGVYPERPDDVSNIEPDARHRRAVTLVKVTERRHWLPTEGRWQSFGWPVTSAEEVR